MIVSKGMTFRQVVVDISGRTFGTRFVPSKTRAHEDSSLEECISTVWTRYRLCTTVLK